MGGNFRTRRRLSAFQQKKGNCPSYSKSIHMPHLCALRGCSLVSSTAAEKQKVGGVSGNTLRYLNWVILAASLQEIYPLYTVHCLLP